MLKEHIQKFYRFYIKDFLHIGVYYGLIPLTKPVNVMLNLTYACNLRCLHCDYWKKKKREEELSTYEIKKLISDLRDWLGNFFLLISGGEPFMRKDLLEIANYAGNMGIRVHVNTNAALINKTLAKKIINSKIDAIFISLDSLNPKEYDFTRNVYGTTKKVLNAIDYLTKFKREMNSDIKIRIHLVIMEKNLDSIINLVNFVKINKQIDCINFGILLPNFDSKYNYRWYKKSVLWFKDPKKVISLLNQLIAIKICNPHLISNSFKELKNMGLYAHNPLIKKKICLQFGDLRIDPFGNFKTCFKHSPVLLGNVRKQGVQDLWSSNKKKLITLSRGCTAPCGNFSLDYNVGFKRRLKKLKYEVKCSYGGLKNNQNAKL